MGVTCGKCGATVPEATYNLLEGTAWCGACETSVSLATGAPIPEAPPPSLPEGLTVSTITTTRAKAARATPGAPPQEALRLDIAFPRRGPLLTLVFLVPVAAVLAVLAGDMFADWPDANEARMPIPSTAAQVVVWVLAAILAYAALVRVVGRVRVEITSTRLTCGTWPLPWIRRFSAPIAEIACIEMTSEWRHRKQRETGVRYSYEVFRVHAEMSNGKKRPIFDPMVSREKAQHMAWILEQRLRQVKSER